MMKAERIGEEIEGEDRHPMDSAARDHVEHAQDAAGLSAENFVPGRRVNAGQWDVGAEPADKKGGQREKHP